MNIEFYLEVAKLKDMPRTGWVKRDIPNPETVAAHMYGSQFIAYDMAKKLGEDPVACAHLMNLHDLPEAHAGDISPTCGVSKEEKRARELKAAKELVDLSGNPEFYDAFLEYEEKTTLRSKIANDADQLDCLVMALKYARLHPEKRPLLESFWPYAQKKIITDLGHEMFGKLLRQKQGLYYVPLGQKFIP